MFREGPGAGGLWNVKAIVRPSFLIIGAQKCGTTWLWDNLKSHPGTSLGANKEIQFFSAARNLDRGLDWYYLHFARLDPTKVVGEASTDYFYDRVLIDNLRVDESRPVIPELIRDELPGAKILLILRDPVKRAISAYYHHIQRRRIPPRMGLVEADRLYPYLRIISRGYYAKYLRVWLEYFPSERFRIFVFEEDVLKTPEETLRNLYEFLGLDPTHRPRELHRASNQGWNWTHITAHYYLGPLYKGPYTLLQRLGFRAWLQKIDFLKRPALPPNEIDTLRAIYSPETEALVPLTGRDLACWA